MLPEKQFTLHFDDVRVSADRLVGTEGEGFAQVFHGLNPERVTGAAVCVGIGRYALKKAAEYANTRVVWISRSARTKASRTHSPRRRSKSRSPR
jgi:alkylation response protein AidB-like acyl-CoA dehydrogenase